MTPGQTLELLVNMDRVRADELLRDRPHELTAEGLYHATLLVTGDVSRAEKAYSERALDEMRREDT